MYEISVMLIFNNHLGNQPMKKIEESNDTAEAKDILSCFKWKERSGKSGFGSKSVFHDIICCRLDSLISRLSFNSICEKIKRSHQVSHHGLVVQQRGYWLADTDGPISSVS